MYRLMKRANIYSDKVECIDTYATIEAILDRIEWLDAHRTTSNANAIYFID